MYNLLIILISIVFLAGCSTKHIIKQDEVFILDNNAKLILTNNKKINVNMLATSGDSIEFKLSKTGQNLSYPKSGIKQLVVTHRGKAALESGLIFASAGFLIGYIVAPEDKTAIEGFNGEEWISMKTFAAFAEGSLFGMLGFAGGLIIGKKDIYLFEEQAPSALQRSQNTFNPDSTGYNINFDN
jgi:hypothetical protein